MNINDYLDFPEWGNGVYEEACDEYAYNKNLEFVGAKGENAKSATVLFTNNEEEEFEYDLKDIMEKYDKDYKFEE